ncbi:MAG TPA: hypothetical protein PK760_13710, partial [Flavobacteriales bacterium]|nr:hypothetical protein [Flavobacteriales bacterium]
TTTLTGSQSLNTATGVNANWLRGSIEIKQAFAYNERNKQLRLRAFAGTYLFNSDDYFTNQLDAWSLTWGAQDMLYDHAYLQRNADTHLLSRQFNKQQGGFKTPFLQGGSETWIASLNGELDLPFKLPIALFGSVGWVPVTTITQSGKSTSTATYVEAGVGLPIVKDVFEVWFPLYVSKRIADEETYLDRTISDRIRFVIALEKLDPTRMLRALKP